jgi:Zn finger protein HypA/HybF involved in hydrogenase expression
VEEVRKCQECGRVLRGDSTEPYCKACDEKLDKQFDIIEDNIIIYKELLDSEIEILRKFEDSDIEDLFKKVYEKLSGEEGGLKKEGIAVLSKLKNAFDLKESKLGIQKLAELKNHKKSKQKNNCPECNRKIKQSFVFCPYCGYKLKDDL